MSKAYYLGVDQGTSGTTALILDEKWNVCAKGYRQHAQIYPKPGWVEHDPEEIWQRTQESIESALDAAGLRAGDIRVMGLANQGETCMLWDRKTGAPVYNAIVWQDRRTAQAADRLKADHEDLIREKTGLPVDAYFSGLKIQWILDNVANARRRAENGELMAGTLDTYLLWKLSGGRLKITDPSTASRTMIFNIHTGLWDREILGLLNVPRSILPEIVDSCGGLGSTKCGLFGAAIPIGGSLVDQPAALFGQACFQPGGVKTTYGTGCFMLTNTGNVPVPSLNGLVTTIVWRICGETTFALDGGVYITGAAVQWLRDGLQIIHHAAETEALSRTVPDTGGVYFVPAFVGLAAPHWDQYARGMIIGITGGTTRAHIARATLEAIAFQVRENLDVMRIDSGMDIKAMRADGGAVGNDFLMQLQADMLGIPVDVPVINETTALGAAYMAALGIGDFGSLDEISANWKLRKRYEPAISEDERASRLANWKKAVGRCRRWADQ
ncbi:MAG: glycerol kinase GlpK [Acidobacteriota bacterium]|nr:glycerol kinase GlpK [Acidobacteriota bacterium]